jgi:hypothetical protein
MSFNIDNFSTMILTPIIIILGLFGNLFGLIVISKKKLKKIGPQIIYITLFLFDLINLALIFKPYIQYEFNKDITIISKLACKSYWYINYVFGAISPMFMVYISFEQFISLAYSNRKYFLLNNRIQLIFIASITLFNILVNLPVLIYFDVVNELNQTTCDFVDVNWMSNLGYLDLFNRVCIPILLMIISSLLIIGTILIKSRSRILSNNNTISADNNIFRKHVHISLISVCLNISYILFSLPVSILILFSNYWLNPFYVFFVFIYFLAYSIKFYLIFSMNRLFRGGFYSIFVHNHIDATSIAKIIERNLL